MSFLISDAMAEGAAAQPGGGFELFIFVGLFFLIMYFMIIRPQSKRAKEHKQLVEGLSRGDEIVTNGGILGKITEVDESFVQVEVAKDVTIQVQKHAIGNVMPKGTYKSN